MVRPNIQLLLSIRTRPWLSLADSKHESPSLLARRLRLRLVPSDGSGIIRNLPNMLVSIHAIATFQALHDYLQPRVAGLMSSGSRLPGMFAALTALVFFGFKLPAIWL